MSLGRDLPPHPFQQRHPLDRAFIVLMLGAIWAAMLSGFIYKNVQKSMAGNLVYPWIVNVHGVFFVGWLFLFTAQVLLIRQGQVATHRRLGMLGAALAAIMVVLGVMTAVITERIKFGTLDADAPFVSVMFGDMLVFAGLVTGGILLRSSPAAHKRLMLVATLVLTDAGFGRWLSPAIAGWMGHTNYWEIHSFSAGAWPFIRFQLLPVYILIGAVGAFDLFTRKRLHPAYLAAIAWSLPIHLLAGWLYFQPFWGSIARRIIGH